MKIFNYLAEPAQNVNTRHFRVSILFLLMACLISACATAGDQLFAHKSTAAATLQKGTFLIASNKLANSSFKETVILITHYSNRGTSGIAINRPSTLAINEAFPELKPFKGNREELYLGGPVRSNAIFVLLQTQQPDKGMKKINDDFYFAPGIHAFAHKKSSAFDNEEERARAFAGYSGWAAGQLENEIKRGDWLVIQSDLNIIFSQDEKLLWKQLHLSWSGTWI